MGSFMLPTMRDGALLLLMMLSAAGDMDLTPEQLRQHADVYFPGVSEACIRAIAVPSDDNLDKVLDALGSEHYADRLIAERALAVMAPFVRRRMALLSVNREDPHVRYVLRRIVFLTREQNPGSLLPARLVAVRLLRSRGASSEQVLVQAMSDELPAVQWAALDELVRLKGEGAIPIVTKFIKDNRDSLARRPMFLARAYKRLGAINIKERSGRGSLVAFLADEFSHAGGASEPLLVASALVEALNSCGTRMDVVSAVTRALSDTRLGFARGGSRMSPFAAEFFAALDPEEFKDIEGNGLGVIQKWLKDTGRSTGRVKALKAGDWSNALRILLDGARRDILLREQRRVMPFLPANTSFVACLDVDGLRGMPLRRELLQGLHCTPDREILDAMESFCEIIRGRDVARVYFAATDDFPFDRAFFSRFVGQGVLDLKRLDGLLQQRGLGIVVITGDFNSVDMVRAIRVAMPFRMLFLPPAPWGLPGGLRFTPLPAVQYGVCALGDGAVGIVFGKDGHAALLRLYKAWKTGAVVLPGELQQLLRDAFHERGECAFAVSRDLGRQLLFLSAPVKIFQKIKYFRMSLSLGEAAKLRLECGMRTEYEAKRCAVALARVIEMGKSIKKMFPAKAELAQLYENAGVTTQGKRAVLEDEIARDKCAGILKLLAAAVLKSQEKAGKSGRRGGIPFPAVPNFPWRIQPRRVK